MATVGTQLLGREAELTEIRRFLDAADGGPAALLLEGEPGIGKTSLWTAAIDLALALRYRVLKSAPAQIEMSLPYAVLGDLLDPYPEAAVSMLPGPMRTALEAALLRAAADDRPVDQLAVSNGFLRTLRGLASDAPVLVAVDDVQWTDGASLRVLAFAAHRLTGEAVKIVAARRTPPLDLAAPTLERAIGGDRSVRLELAALTPAAVDDLLLRRLARPLTRPQLEHVCRFAGGNPFFALELGRFVSDHASRLPEGVPPPLPTTLLAAVEGRLQGLKASTRDLLVAVAALSRPDEATLERADTGATGRLAPAFTAGVVERVGGRLRFAHPLLASAAYGMATVEVRRIWHQRLAEVVGDPEERARHLALAATGPNAGVAEALEQAARLANARGAPDAAAGLAEQAAALTPGGQADATQRRRIESARYRLRAGDTAAAREALEAVLRRSAGARPPEALRLMATIMFIAGELPEARRYLTEALARAAGDDRAEALIRRDLTRVLHQSGDLAAAREHAAGLAEIADRTGDQALSEMARRLNAHQERHTLGMTGDMLATAVAVADGRLGVMEDDSPGVMHPFFEWGVLLKWADDFPRARSLLKRVLELTEGRDELLRVPALFHLAEMECWSGDWVLAELYTTECEKAVRQSGQRAYARLSLVAGAQLQCCRGELAGARAAAEEALTVATAVGDGPYRWRALAILGSAQLAAGDAAAANGFFARLREQLADGYPGPVRSEGDEIDALLALGRVAEAERALDRLVPGPGRWASPWQTVIEARGRALVAAARGDLEAADAGLERALAVQERLPMPLERGRTLLAQAAVLRRAKQKAAAREAAVAARRVFENLGAAAWAARAGTELARIAPAAAGHALTPTEARVAELVASGHSNKEVAAQLYMSVKTVEANLSRVFAKLGVRSRTELAARAASGRLV